MIIGKSLMTDRVFSFDVASAVEMCIKKCATMFRKEM